MGGWWEHWPGPLGSGWRHVAYLQGRGQGCRWVALSSWRDPPPVFSASLACLRGPSVLSPEHENPPPRHLHGQRRAQPPPLPPASGPHSWAPSVGAVAAHRAPPQPVALGLTCSRRKMKEGPKGRGRKISSLFLAVSGKLLSVHFLKFIIYLLLAALGLHFCPGFSLVAAGEGYSLAVVCGLLLAGASLVAEHRP